MTLQILKCPNCGAGVPAYFAGAVAACEFCGAVLSGLALKPVPTPIAPPSAAAPAHPPVASPPARPSPRAPAVPPTETAMLDLARRRLGARDSLYFDGNIPAGKLEAAYATHGAGIGRVLAQYDDTLFGGADDGFVLTAAALHWKNLAEEPRALRWVDLDPASVEAAEDGVTLGDQKIDVVLVEGKPMIAGAARLISELAAWAQGHGPPRD